MWEEIAFLVDYFRHDLGANGGIICRLCLKMWNCLVMRRKRRIFARLFNMGQYEEDRNLHITNYRGGNVCFAWSCD